MQPSSWLYMLHTQAELPIDVIHLTPILSLYLHLIHWSW
jgi:hypothetical protein